MLLVHAATDDATITTAAAEIFVINLGYNNFTQDPIKRIARSNYYGITIKDAVSTTSHFIRHLKTHWTGESLGEVEVIFSAYECSPNMFSSTLAR